MNIVEIELKNLKEKYTLNYIAKQSSGSVLYQSGGTVILASVAVDEKIVEEDFLPLTVQYIEKSYAVGKFPGGFIKREGKPGEFETLTSRIIDRTLRPVFPKGYSYPTQITLMVLSCDKQSDLQVCALNAAANALYVSSLPFYHPINALRVGMIEGEFIINPTMQELDNSTLDLYVSGSNDELLMIEMRSLAKKSGANEISEEKLLDALSLAKDYISNSCMQYQKAFDTYKENPLNLVLRTEKNNPQIYQYIQENYIVEVQNSLQEMAKSERNTGLKKIAESIAQNTDWEISEINPVLENYKKEIIRHQILEQKTRCDGRGYEDIRPIQIQTNILPFAHGSALFTRGQTQALVVSTIGADSDAQTQEMLTDKIPNKEKFMFHYNFPGFSVGEASMIGSVGRRELGHGNLAKRALESSILDHSKTIRLVSEILESNGSSSMASVCGGSLALCASGIEISSLVAGVAMGLVVQEDKYAILTDINGLEDHDGDMDFKIAGSKDGITAMQMDIKMGGISHHILKEALYQAKKAREYILNIMEEARSKIILNTDILPSSEVFNVPSSKIVEIIGQGGRVIKDIIERFGVSIDLNREDGEVKISGSDKNNVTAAKDFIINLIQSQKIDLSKYETGLIFEGEVKKVLDFGAFVSLPNGGDGLLHISKITKNRDESIKNYISEGDRVRCQILGLNKGKIELDLIKS
ncbi:polyribonucleotide nucleotidyltransferase [Helicobacter cappadocius]|uniref:Polyribonucleotide nucleotidyltransferase n=1 Tax=Helicobacter cappadocius TaxID=3063998 RepID=A0AA90PZU0_9HELI|nr:MULTISPECIES: polyribonucleotide nucleotidyltransferase [unclassified Helicobacter]MDO7253580.1 polyribonucleotide nucleotidyltransferase [Helicobacter sp. faydin-H75]MDP2539508.1 polyribonucleotide nucleotidyltransferase [Helicobacter sp. faydin-H76]